MAQDLKQDFNIRLPSVPHTNDPELNSELLIVYNSMRLLADQVERRYRLYVPFGATLGVGVLVYFYDAGAGVQTVQAAAYGVNEANAVTTIAATAGSSGEVMLLGKLAGFTGLTIGQKFWLSAVPGAFTAASPGANSQRVGYALSTTELWVNPMMML